MSGEDYLIEPADLESRLSQADVAVVDLSHLHHYRSHRIPGARHLEYKQILCAAPPVEALAPSDTKLAQILGGLGLDPDQQVVAYDDEGGIKAAHFLWALDLSGHRRWSLLNGGLHAWLAEQQAVESGDGDKTPNDYFINARRELCVENAAVMTRLDDPAVVFVDARTLAEYRGLDRRAAHGGHLPGAINVDWTMNIDPEHKVRLRPAGILRQMYEWLGVTRDRDVVVYCQNMKRAAHTYVTLKTLGYERVSGYPGGWSEWGNLPDTPKNS